MDVKYAGYLLENGAIGKASVSCDSHMAIDDIILSSIRFSIQTLALINLLNSKLAGEKSSRYLEIL